MGKGNKQTSAPAADVRISINVYYFSTSSLIWENFRVVMIFFFKVFSMLFAKNIFSSHSFLFFWQFCFCFILIIKKKGGKPAAVATAVPVVAGAIPAVEKDKAKAGGKASKKGNI